MNNKIQIKIENFENKFTLLTYNIDQAVREEKYEETKWKNRKEFIKKLIIEVNADIVCLQELRKLYKDDEETTEMFLALLSKELNYRFIVDYRNAGELAFGNAILWKYKKFAMIKHKIKYLSETPNIISDTWSENYGFGAIINGVLLYPVKNEKIIINSNPFWIFNTHFPLEEEFKTKSCKFLVEYLGKLKEEWLLCGDFNFFEDKDLNSDKKVFGSKQREILTKEGEFQDLCKDSKTLGGKKIVGTFIGFNHDEFKSDLDNMNSRLDHIFSSKNIKGSNASQYTRSMKKDFKEDIEEELTHRNYPSDHLPQLIEIYIK